MYAPLYDGDHRAITVSATGAVGVQTIQKGLRERLLCQDCEGRLAEWERIVAPAWRMTLDLARGQAMGTVITVPCPYVPLKLFTLSLFFRASVAAHSNFGSIVLGDAVENAIRAMLLAGCPGAVTDYPTCLVGHAGLKHAIGTIGLSGGGDFRGVRMVRLDISGLTWFVAIGSDITMPVNLPLAVTHHGLRTIISNVDEREYLQKIADARRDSDLASVRVLFEIEKQHLSDDAATARLKELVPQLIKASLGSL